MTPEQLAILENIASGIRQVTSDSVSTQMQSITQQIEALKLLAAQDAAKANKLGIRIMKVQPGDALGQP